VFVRSLIVLAAVSAATAAPVPKSLKAKASKFDTARFKLNYQNAPFERVLADFAEGTGLEWAGERPALGAITLKPTKEFSAVELLDLLNEVLEQYDVVLVRHAGTFYLHPAGKPVDPEQVDTVTVDDIIPRREAADPPAAQWGGRGENGGWENGVWVPRRPVPQKRGKTELATLVIEPTGGLTLAEARPQINKSLTPFGRIAEDEGDNKFRITDRVDNLRLIARILTEPVRGER
jgi:hypothetical protein